MRALVKSVESPVLLVSSFLHRHHGIHNFTDLTLTALRGRDQQPGYFINFTYFTDLSSERPLHRPQLGSRIGYNICMFKFYFNYYKKYVRIVRVSSAGAATHLASYPGRLHV
jgi:hypothetical protein